MYLKSQLSSSQITNAHNNNNNVVENHLHSHIGALGVKKYQLLLRLARLNHTYHRLAHFITTIIISYLFCINLYENNNKTNKINKYNICLLLPVFY